MSLVDKKMLMADGLSKWLWTYRGNLLFATVYKRKIQLRLSRRDKHGEPMRSLKIMDLKETKKGIIVPSSKEIDKALDKKSMSNRNQSDKERSK
ncbi:hypothetical protein LCGC14_2257370 [marine sediment metagenome]|uniref:Uncharacterized protein n=1 Tax=marine sediment metagenome TaxID=412755 RepID=A0A0F9FD85_9ZZZZ